MNLSLNINNLTPTDAQYRELIADVLENGSFKGDRTGTGTYAVVGRMARYSLLNGRSPRPTTKEMKDTPEREMLWFVGGSSSIRELRDQKIGIWNSWLIPGSAKYEALSFEEVEKAICKKLSVDFFSLSTIDDDVREVLDLQDFTGDLYVFRHTADNGAGVFFTQHVWDGFVRESYRETKEIAMAYIAGWFNISTKRLIDGDIGPGGYGPQWRHWKDTQIIPQAELQAYRAQGYNVLGDVRPEIEHEDEEAIKADLTAIYRGQGFEVIEFEKLDFDQLPDRGYDVYTEGKSVKVVYGREIDLERVYIQVADLPRWVVHREIDQLQNAINLLRNDPNSRRIIVSAWNPALTWKAALPPCHLYFQFISHELTLEQRYTILCDTIALEERDYDNDPDKTDAMKHALRDWKTPSLADMRQINTDEQIHEHMDAALIHRRGLYCFLLLRSNDLGLGQPFNVAQYASMTHMVAQCVNMAPLELVWAAVDAHVYTNHVEALQKQLTIESKDCIPRIVLNKDITDIDGFSIDDIKVIDYESHEALTKHMPVAV